MTPSTNEWRLVSSSIFVFRLLDVDDERNRNEYPLQVFKHRGKRLRCRVCDVYTARYLFKILLDVYTARYLFKILLLQRNLCAVFIYFFKTSPPPKKKFAIVFELSLDDCNTQEQPTFGDPNDWFPRQMTSEKRAQKFHTDDVSLPSSG